MEIWLNPACSKCRTAVAELDAAGVEYTVRRYLEDPPTAAELGAVVDRLGLEPWDVARPAESREAGIDLPRDVAHRSDWLAALAAHPHAISGRSSPRRTARPWSAATRTRCDGSSMPRPEPCPGPRP